MMLLALAASATTTLTVGSAEVNGLAVRDLTCTIERGGLLLPTVMVGSLAARKSALDACAPDGAAARLQWTLANGALVQGKVLASSRPTADACLLEAASVASLADASWSATCTLTLLVGAADAAAKAATTLESP